MSITPGTKVLRVARTIADLEGSEDIKPQRIAEAEGYRSLDRSVWP
jgi:magnesium chelatase family protein